MERRLLILHSHLAIQTLQLSCSPVSVAKAAELAKLWLPNLTSLFIDRSDVGNSCV